MKKRLRIIGGVAAGPASASRARRIDSDLDIVIYEKGPYISYGACSEPYYIAGYIDDYNKFIARTPDVFKKNTNIDVKILHEVIKIDSSTKTITVLNKKDGNTFTDNYDKLIITTGTNPIEIPVPGTNLPGVFRMKELTDAISMKEYISKNKPARAVTVGAGFIALEMAEAFNEIGIKNTILHKGKMPVARLDEDMAQLLIEEMKNKKIDFMPEVDFLGVEQSGENLVVKTSKGDLAADIVLIAVGVKPNVSLAKDAGITIGKTGAIHVNEKQETDIPDIYAAGDCCEVINRIGGHYVNTPLGDLSNKQGWVAGENAAGGNITYPGVLGSAHFKFCGLEIAFTGISAFEAKNLNLKTISYSTKAPSKVESFPGSSPITIKYLIEDGTSRLLGAQMVGANGVAHRINTLAAALYNKMTVDEIADIDFAYAPPFSPVIDPILRAARGAVKET
ncbi:MAG: FAD-dependent oxidoreductase [Spirochaetes bacterium]|nr:FAD-dependent oxidoreductase [Spirochaetota bacterium]